MTRMVNTLVEDWLGVAVASVDNQQQQLHTGIVLNEYWYKLHVKTV